MYKNAFEQMNEVEVEAVGILVGVDNPGASFRNYLRDMNPLPDGWTIGDMARAYLNARLEKLSENKNWGADLA